VKSFKFIYSVIISLSLLSSNIFCNENIDMSQNENSISQEELDLAKMTEELMSSMTPEQRNEVDQELARFMALPEDEQGTYLENKFKELSVDLEKAEALQNENQTEVPEPQEEIKTQEKKEVKPILKSELTKVEQVQNSLKKIITHVQPLILKTKVLPQVSKNCKTEKDWLSLSDSLIELNSFAKVISNKENLIDILASEEFLLLRDQLKEIANNLEEGESSIIVPDTAGLTINYDDEEAEESTLLIEAAQNQLNLIIPKLKTLVEDDQILWGLKRLLQKYAPEELQKVEAEKKVEKKFIADFKPGKETPSTAKPKYIDPYFPYYGNGGGYNPSSTSYSSDRSPLTGSSAGKNRPSGQGGGKSEKGKDKAGDKDKGNKEGKDKEANKDGKDKGKDKKPFSTDLKSFEELQTYLDNISKLAKESKILDLIPEEKEAPSSDKENAEPKTEEQKKAEQELAKQNKEKIQQKVKQLVSNSRELVQPFIQINMNYEKASKAVVKINSSLKSAPDEMKKLAQEKLKSLFEKPALKKINQAYNLIKDQLDKITRRPTTDTSAQEATSEERLKAQVYSFLKYDKELKEALSGKKPKSEKDKTPGLPKPVK
jgi:hypothetical protein